MARKIPAIEEEWGNACSKRHHHFVLRGNSLQTIFKTPVNKTPSRSMHLCRRGDAARSFLEPQIPDWDPNLRTKSLQTAYNLKKVKLLWGRALNPVMNLIVSHSQIRMLKYLIM